MENVVVLLRLLGVKLEEGLPRKRVVRGSNLVTNTEHVSNMRVTHKYGIHKNTVKEE